jgi:hypothetical protein
MTSEVVLMNRSAVALASDSATTVTHWHRNGRETRFYKGANKVFNLAYGHPVGLMTYNMASLLGVPLEVVVKAHRAQLDGGFSKLEDYAENFFAYLPSETRLFPNTHQEEHFKAQAAHVAITLLGRINSSVSGEEDPEVKKTSVAQVWGMLKQFVEKDSFLANATDADVKGALAGFHDGVAAQISGDEAFVAHNPGVDWRDLAATAIVGLYKKQVTVLDKTGIVIAGYGEDEFFPSCIVYECWGVLLGKVLYSEVNRKVVSHGNTAHIVPLAQSEMMNTFIHGISPAIVADIGAVYRKELHEFEKQACGEASDREDLRAAAGEKFLDVLLDQLFEKHTAKLRRVVGSLPIDELAELAETLISLESLKERVTRTSESVSGPVDVAVISKGDGFIWIKRKHYFDPALNPRFLAMRRPAGGATHGKDRRPKARRDKRSAGPGRDA